MSRPAELPEIQKISGGLIVPAEMLADYEGMRRSFAALLAPDTRTPAERAAARAAAEAEDARQLADAQSRHAVALTAVSGRLADVLDAHGPQMRGHWPVCDGCDVDGWDAEQPEWPCTTWTLIAEEEART